MTEWMPELPKAEGRIHVAGEHTSLLSRPSKRPCSPSSGPRAR